MPQIDFQTPGLPSIDADEVDRFLEEGWTLPSTLYTDPAVARLEDELIWKPAWQEIGALADFREPGDFLTAKLGKYPVLVVLDGDRQLRAFLNVCRHRGALLAGGEMGDQADNVSGNCKGFTCRYHGWRYGLDGQLKGAPNWKDGKLPPFEELELRAVSVDTWAGIVFVSIEPTESLSEFVSDLPHIAEQKGYEYSLLNQDLELALTYEWDVKANWKAFMENNLECYHCSTTHTNTLAAIFKVDIHNFCTVNFKNGNHLGAPFTDDLDRKIGPETAASLTSAAERKGEQPFQQYWVAPNNMFTTGIGLGDALYRINPTGPTSCRMISRVYLPKGDNENRERLDEFMGELVNEDIRISGGVQIGLESGTRESGPLLAQREDSLRWFSAYVWERLAPAFR
jgi:phenylpropionate dioxygenase-like ring-hydroxylating dioxygenase large terminal subunit